MQDLRVYPTEFRDSSLANLDHGLTPSSLGFSHKATFWSNPVIAGFQSDLVLAYGPTCHILKPSMFASGLDRPCLGPAG